MQRSYFVIESTFLEPQSISDDTDRGSTPSFQHRRPGEETLVKLGNQTRPTIHRTDISFDNNECCEYTEGRIFV